MIVEAADGPGSTVLAAVNVYDCSYLYFIGVGITGGGGDVLHFEKGDHILLRGVRLTGTGDIFSYAAPDETLKVNQSQYVYVEDSEIAGATANAIDFVAVQYGHIVRNRIHHGGDWCMYLKGGSAYYRIEGNEIFDCGTGGFTAGQGSGLEFMVSPWIHYEASDIQFVNNVIHDTEGAGFGANGAYNTLFAYNTLYRVGGRSHAIEAVYGYRSCDGDTDRCAALLAEGGWGVANTDDSESIPNRNIYVYNNLVYNPPDSASAWQQFAIYGPVASLPGANLDAMIADDTNLQIRGNLIWNGAPDLALGIEGSDQGCQPENTTCNAAQLMVENLINSWQPSLANPDAGDFHLQADAAVPGVTFPIPDFPGDDRPNQPLSPPSYVTNAVLFDRDGNPRAFPDAPGAYALPLLLNQLRPDRR